MGLDLNALGKPKPGNEEEFNQLFFEISRSKGDERQRKIDRWFEIQISPFETLSTPRIGIDKSATDWLRDRYHKEGISDQTEEEYLQKHHGMYLPSLTKRCDGTPIYSNSGMNIAAIHSFRGQFVIDDCMEIVGDTLANRLYQSALAKETLELGELILRIAREYAEKEDLGYVENLKVSDAGDKSKVQNVHILFSLAKWLKYWGSQGHGYEADY